MRALWLSVLALVIGGLAATGCGSSSTSSATVAAPCRTGSGVTAHATTKTFQIQLDVGPIETMYTPAQVASEHPMGGEVMLRGQMASLPGMAGMPGMSDMSGAADVSDHHLEAHICSITTGAPVQNANPTIVVTDSMNSSQNVPIAVMQGNGEGVSDYHYGNNVLLPAGSFTVLVSLSGETATFHITIPPAATTSPTMSSAGSPTTRGGMTTTTTGDGMGGMEMTTTTDAMRM